MYKISAEFEMTTPGFVGGVAPGGDPELRALSIRGVLRFWWRALMFAKYAPDFRAFSDAETRLFGSTQGQGGVHFLPIRLDNPGKPEPLGKTPGLKYLGYGVGARKGWSKPWRFTIAVLVRETVANELEATLKVLGLLGGLGARSRRGFGSVSLLRLERDGELAWSAPADIGAWKTAWQDALASVGFGVAVGDRSYPDITSLGPLTRIHLLATDPDPARLLDQVGQEFQRYRSYGRDGKVLDRPAEQNFRADHDLMWNALNRKSQPNQAPERTIFGLPHNYFFSKTGLTGSVTSGRQRRGSPLFFHLQKLGSTYGAIAAVLPAKFTLAEKLYVTGPKIKYQVPADIEQFYPVIERFITGTRAGTDSPRFPQQERLWP